MDNGRDNDCDVKVVKIVEQLERNETWFSSPSPLVKSNMTIHNDHQNTSNHNDHDAFSGKQAMSPNMREKIHVVAMIHFCLRMMVMTMIMMMMMMVIEKMSTLKF